ncbi:MAG: glycosyltransferase [Clostridia bacterium]|nr:glycosyltransferase [Clostridia bacterium]
MFLSIICPCYNVEKYLETCVNSVAIQNIGNFEMILVNDGSTDSTPTLCDEFAKKFDFIKVVHKVNGGVSSARNAGLKTAQGKKILFLDSDDLLFENALESLKKIIEENENILYFNFNHGVVSIDVNQPVIHSATLTEGISQKNIFLREFFNHNHQNFPWTPWQNVYDLAYIKNNNLSFNEALSNDEDFLFNFEYLKNVETVYHSNIPIVKYRVDRPRKFIHRFKSKKCIKFFKESFFHVQ